MNTRRGFFESLTAVVLLAMASMASGDDHSRRAKIPSPQAMSIAGELFPERCGHSGNLCGITYDDQRACPLEFVIEFPPSSEETKRQPERAWVTLNNAGMVIHVSSNKRGSCKRGIAS